MILLFSAYEFYIFPRKASLTYYGIKYKADNSQHQEQVKIEMTGFYSNRLFTKDYFEGSISIDNESYPPKGSNYPGLRLIVCKDLQILSYRDFDGDKAIHTYGEIFLGKSLKELTILLQDGHSSRNSKDGYIISAPANNRAEAVKITNELMNSILKNTSEYK